MSRAAAALVALCVAPWPLAAQVVFQGGELQVNTYTIEHQIAQAVGGTGSGFVVVSESSDQDGSGFGVFAQRFSSAGARLGGEFQVTVHTANTQRDPSMATLGSGFVVVWKSGLGQDGNGYGTFGRRFGSDGVAIGGEFQVNTRTTGDQDTAAVAMTGGGDFVVVWESYGDYFEGGVFGQRFSSSGARVGGEFLVNTFVMGPQLTPDVAKDGSGFLVVWQSGGQDGDAGGIFGQRFDGFGLALGGEFQVNSLTVGDQNSPAVVSNESGFVVVWSSPDGIGAGAFGRRFSSSGVAQASEFRINGDLPGSQYRPDVASNGSSFLVVWDVRSGARDQVRGRRLDGLGIPTDVDVQVNVYSNGYQNFPSVAYVDGTGFVVVWSSYQQDGFGYGVFARRASVLADLDVDGNGAVAPLTDGLLALRYTFGFRGATLVVGAVGQGCTRCDAPSIEAYLAGKT